MKTLNRVMRVVGGTITGACVGNGIAAFVRGDMFSVFLMATLVLMNLTAIVLLIITDMKGEG